MPQQDMPKAIKDAMDATAVKSRGQQQIGERQVKRDGTLETDQEYMVRKQQEAAGK